MARPERLSALILRPSVIGVLAWATLAVAWFLWTLAWTPRPPAGEPWSFVHTPVFVAGCLVQLALVGWSLFDLRRTRESPIGLRRAQRIGGAAALLLLAQLQVLGTLAYLGGTL